MPRATITVGPSDHGRRMSLEEFDRAEGREGYRYELSRGVICVADIPGYRHLVQVDRLRSRLSMYQVGHPGRICCIAGAGECKLLVADLECERHPDVAVYQSNAYDEEDVWGTWIPEIVVEVVSPESEHCDYVEKREEYLAFGVREYWIIDAEKRQMTALRRWRGRWSERIVRPPEVYTTRLLPDFEFRIAEVFAAAEARPRRRRKPYSPTPRPGRMSPIGESVRAPSADGYRGVDTPRSPGISTESETPPPGE